MSHSSTIPSRLVRPSSPLGRPGGARRILAVPVLALATAVALLFVPALANADSPSTLTVVGTSDVSDSGLIANLIQPEFENAYPQFTFKYVGSATGMAIQSAEAGGATGPSVLIVHAASLENTFVTPSSGPSFSYQGQPGYAIFRNDFVLAGPTADPAGVATNAGNDVAQAFADIATSGVTGHATFVSRGGTNTAPGTTVEEHKLWALMFTAGLTPTGVVVCTVSAADGGGMTPISPAKQTTSNQACPDNGTVAQGDAPSWYFINSPSTQAANVEAANSCTVGNGAGTCYVLSDRGTVDYLASGTYAASGNLIPNLKIVTRNDSASAPGGANELVNYFHAYIINPSAPNEAVNLEAAQDFIKFLTSPGLQLQLVNYLRYTSDGIAFGPPFLPDASPTFAITSNFPRTVATGKSVTATGTLNNAEIGYPVLSNKPVAVDEIVAGLPTAVPGATATTDSSGHFSITFTPKSSGPYQLSTPQFTQLEDATLSPTYSDTLSPGASTPVTMNVQSSVSISSAHASPGGVTVSGKVSPGAPDRNARIAILARPKGSKHSFTEIGATSLAANQSSYAISGSLKAGTWQVEAKFTDPGEILAATSRASNVKVPATSTAVSFKKLTVKNGALTVTGKLSQARTASGAKVELFGLKTVRVKTTRKGIREAGADAHSAAVAFPKIAKTSLKAGKTTFTIKAKLTRGYRWILQLEVVQKGQTSSFSKLGSIDVH